MAKTYKLLEVKDLNTSFKIDAGKVLAVNGVSFTLEKGKVLGIVGESGSGKSVTAYSIMRILDKNGHIDSGKIIYNGTDLVKISEKEMRDIRGNKISIIFQDAMTSLNPVWTIGNQLREAILTHAKDPVYEATYPIENDIRSDKQRIASMEKGLRHHPDSQILKDDLEFVRNKLIQDTQRLEEVKKEATQKLIEGERLKDEEFRTNKPLYKEKIRNAHKDYMKNYWKLNKKPTQEDLDNNKKVSEAKAKLNDSITKLHKELEIQKDVRNQVNEMRYNLSRMKKDDPKYLKDALALNAYKADLIRIRGLISKARQKVRKARRDYQKQVRKFNNRVIYAKRYETRDIYLKAKRDLYEYYWECKSAFRETKYSANKKALKMLIEVGITEPEKRLNQYPFELSGGMLQRCMIAMALVEKPDILIADEPTTALDVTIQAQILELLQELQKEYGMAIIIITHDLGVVAQICDEVDIMYAGRIVERGTVRDIFYNPQHEYTKGLLKSMPKRNQGKEKLVPISGNPVDLFCLPKGCAFSSRCKNCMQICLDKFPEEVEYDKSGHAASCWAMIKRLHEEKKIDIVRGKPMGKPLIYNGAVIHEKKKRARKENNNG